MVVYEVKTSSRQKKTKLRWLATDINLTATHLVSYRSWYEILEEWKRNKGDGATSAKLQEALRKTGRQKILQMIFHHLNDCSLLKYLFYCIFLVDSGMEDPQSASSIVIDQDIKEKVSGMLGDSWKQLARNLPWRGKRDIHIEAIISNVAANPLSQRDRAYEILAEWKRNEGDGATLAKLQETLRKIGRQDIADEISPFSFQ